MWDLPGPGIEPGAPTLAGGFFITEPPGKPSPYYVKVNLKHVLTLTFNTVSMLFNTSCFFLKGGIPMGLFSKKPPKACPKCGRADGWRIVPSETPTTPLPAPASPRKY